MSTHQTGNKNHDDAVAKAESIRQVAAIPGASQSTVRAADVALYRADLASALANGVNPGCFMQALRDLGTGGM
jgi:hypothetical protein